MHTALAAPEKEEGGKYIPTRIIEAIIVPTRLERLQGESCHEATTTRDPSVHMNVPIS